MRNIHYWRLQGDIYYDLTLKQAFLFNYIPVFDIDYPRTLFIALHVLSWALFLSKSGNTFLQKSLYVLDVSLRKTSVIMIF